MVLIFIGIPSRISFGWWKHNLTKSGRPPHLSPGWGGHLYSGGRRIKCHRVNLALGHCPPCMLASFKPCCSSPILVVSHNPRTVLSETCTFSWQSLPGQSFSYFQALLPKQHTFTCSSPIPPLLRSTKSHWLHGQGRTENPWVNI